jgi:hypothetical protein
VDGIAVTGGVDDMGKFFGNRPGGWRPPLGAVMYAVPLPGGARGGGPRLAGGDFVQYRRVSKEPIPQPLRRKGRLRSNEAGTAACSPATEPIST